MAHSGNYRNYLGAFQDGEIAKCNFNVERQMEWIKLLGLGIDR